MELSTTSNTMWCRPLPSSVSPMYIPGRLRTASNPFSTLMLEESYVCFSLMPSLPMVLGLGDTAMFHVEHGNRRIHLPAFPQQFMIHTGDEHLAAQIFQEPAQCLTMLLIQFRR